MPSYEQIVQQVITSIREIVSNNVSHNIDIDENTDFIADLEFDSLKVMNLIEEIEDCYDISVPLNVLADVRTVKDLAVQLQSLAGED